MGSLLIQAPLSGGAAQKDGSIAVTPDILIARKVDLAWDACTAFSAKAERAIEKSFHCSSNLYSARKQRGDFASGKQL